MASSNISEEESNARKEKITKIVEDARNVAVKVATEESKKVKIEKVKEEEKKYFDEIKAGISHEN
jgi:hypothetical protein